MDKPQWLVKKTDFNWLNISVVGLMILLGLFLRLYPGSDNLIWTYDQARDSYLTRSIISDNNIVIVGPQTDYPGLSHGPVSYYFFAPFYHLSHGDPNLPLLASILFGLSALIPLKLLVQNLFNDRRLTYLSMFLYAISYEQIEYSRWIINFTVSLPFLIWSYYFLHKSTIDNTSDNKSSSKEILHSANWWQFGAGLSLGLAIQGEFFLVSLIPFFVLYLYLKDKLKSNGAYLGLGIFFGSISYFLAEIKFNFLGIKTLFGQFIAGHGTESLTVSRSLALYVNHSGMTFQHAVGGLSNTMGFWLLIVLMIFTIWWISQNKKSNQAKSLLAVLGIIAAHSLLFTFNFPDVLFIDMQLGVPLLILVAFSLVKLWDMKWRLLSVGLLLMIITFNGYHLTSNSANQTPLGLYGFAQSGILYSQKMEIVDTMYDLTGTTEPFSLSVIDTPFGVRTVWASIFEQYVKKNHTPLPHWYGYKANGYLGENLFKTQDYPEKNHILLTESDGELIDKSIRDEALSNQNESTVIVEEKELHGYLIQLRKPREN